VPPAAPDGRHAGWVLVGCLTLLVAWSGSGLGWWPLVLTLLALGALTLAGGAWLTLLVKAGAHRRRLAPRFLVAPTLVLATAVLLQANVPGLVRFRLTEGAFDQAVHEDGAFVGRWLGSYRIDEARTIDNGLFFFDHDGSVSSLAGFAYLPSGPSPTIGDGGLTSARFHHLYGHWYTFAATT
jgi:hypothetical protein